MVNIKIKRQVDGVDVLSTFDKEAIKFWEEVGLVVVYTGDGIIIGRITEFTSTIVTVKDLQGLRHWVSQDSISQIVEIGTGKIPPIT